MAATSLSVTLVIGPLIERLRRGSQVPAPRCKIVVTVSCKCSPKPVLFGDSGIMSYKDVLGDMVF